jgi:hypothetical protein
MAFHITVHRRTDDELFRSHPEVGTDDFESWLAECQTRWVYENPFGADGTVHDFWHLPARDRGLPLIGNIYENGLRVEGHQLVELSKELDHLEAIWSRMDLGKGEWITYVDCQTHQLLTVQEHLHERLAYVREAIRAAQDCDGVLEIG